MNYQTRLANLVLVLMIIGQSVAFAPKISAQQANDEKKLLVKHNSVLLLQKVGSAELVLVSIVADPLLWNARAFVHEWTFDSSGQMTEYLQLQDRYGPSIPERIQMSRSKHYPVKSFQEFSVGDMRLKWMGGNRRASWVVPAGSGRMRVADGGRIDGRFQLPEGAFLTWEKFAEKHNPVTYHDSWTDIDAPAGE
ncbi:hypothetical protein [Roseimaritima sediminicola]|uniref:hypothetical protein n=1 Tax=Roseimaritima sediminicola TaxID=2662066 RepID=UPI00129846E0|nr:hypothetical protein [Roseimaritima sediminicola]